MDKFETLLEAISYYHHQLDETMILHQEAMIEGEVQLAKAILKQFEVLLKKHIEVEDNLVNPIHAKYVTEPRWQTEVYLAEHKKIPLLLEKLFTKFEISPTSQPEKNRWIIDILDYERSLKNVLEHHEEREEKGQLIELKTALTHDQYEQLLDECITQLHPISKQVEIEVERLAREIY